ncbi:MAG: helix-turn-helix domain-containing protein [Isosphaeraceae bacterium]
MGIRPDFQSFTEKPLSESRAIGYTSKRLVKTCGLKGQKIVTNPVPQAPGDRIKAELAARGWSQSDLAAILGRPIQSLNQMISGQKAITPETAIQLGVAFGTGPELWIQLESQYRLSLANTPTEGVARRAKLLSLAPYKELQRRGWIRQGDDPAQLEADLLKLFEMNHLDDEPGIQAVMRRSSPLSALSPPQKAWAARVKQLARSIRVAEYREERLEDCVSELRKLAAYSQETRRVPAVLESYGIRFVIVEPLHAGKIDGMATWLDDESPVIALSLRFDRIDNFWHTLCHEISHVRHRDAISVDDDLGGPADPAELPLDVRPPMERRADREAAETLIPPDELESFIRRVGPLYSKARINQFANRLKIHPGIIVGQLQSRKEMGYSANREMLVKIRQQVAPSAFTDGWGNNIEPGAVG